MKNHSVCVCTAPRVTCELTKEVRLKVCQQQYRLPLLAGASCTADSVNVLLPLRRYPHLHKSIDAMIEEFYNTLTNKLSMGGMGLANPAQIWHRL